MWGKGSNGNGLHGWWRGLPFVIVPFAAVFSEAWFRTGIRTSHYELGELSTQLRETQERLQALRVQESELTRLSRIDSAAPDLGLIPPIPGQVVVIELTEGWRHERPIDRSSPVADEIHRLTNAGNVAD